MPSSSHLATMRFCCLVFKSETPALPKPLSVSASMYCAYSVSPCRLLTGGANRNMSDVFTLALGVGAREK